MSSAADIRIHADKFEILIQRRGRDVEWEEALLCSCWNIDSGQPQYGCRACNGKGYTYQPAVVGRVLFTSITQNNDFQEMAGMFHIGDAVMTVPKRVWEVLPNGQFNMTKFTDSLLYNVGMYDVITLTDDEYKSSEVLIRGESLYGREPDTLLNDKIISIQAVRKADPVTGEVTDYKLDEDFRLVGNKIEWEADGTEPSEGDKYSVVYRHRPVFTVLTTLPKPRHQDGQDLPRYVALRYRAAGFEPK